MKCCGRFYVEVGVAIPRKVGKCREQKSISCGAYYRKKSAACVSTAREVL